MAPLIMENDIKVIPLDGSTMESTQISTGQIPGLGKKEMYIHIFPKITTAPLISLGVLCDDGCKYHTGQTINFHPEEQRRNNQRREISTHIYVEISPPLQSGGTKTYM